MDEKLIKLLDRANQRLKLGSTGIVIFRRGNKLSLRGMLPPKPGSGKSKKSQQTISLGIYANAAGIQRAEKEAQKLGSLLALNQFDWSDYIASDSTYNSTYKSVKFWVSKFREDYFNKREQNKKTENTWTDYQKIFNKLNQDEKLTADLMMQVILSTKPDTRTRKKACNYLTKLALFAQIDFDVSAYAGNYSSASLNSRDIPSDQEILKWRERIPNNHGWQYAFGLMAAYGLRNYELFCIDLESIKKSPGHLRIRESKRKKQIERIIWCLYPEWWESWELGNIEQKFPQVTGKNNSELGNRVTKAFSRYGFSKPYNLRHAWAIRAINFIPVEIAAKMMDHSLEIHSKIYQQWINEAHYKDMYKLMMSKNVPKAPQIPHAPGETPSDVPSS